MKELFTSFLIVHIAGGATALIAGFVAMVAAKGGNLHRTSGRFFFWGMTLSCSSALYLGIAHLNPFLLVIAVFSYQTVAMGYRVLYLKRLHTGTVKPVIVDWLIGIVPAIFNISIFCWGIYEAVNSRYFGITGIVFGSIGLLNSFNWLKQFYFPPREKQHWLFAHFQGFGGAYIAATTAFLVVNINVLPGLLVWLSPTVVGATLITLTSIKYKRKFMKNQVVKHVND